MSIPKMAGQLNCHLSSALYIYNKFALSYSTEKKQELGVQLKSVKREGG